MIEWRRMLAAALCSGAASIAAAGPSESPSPKTFGIEGQSVSVATAFDFQATVPTILLGSDAYGYRSMLPPADSVFLFAPVRVPEGAVISFFRLHACDSAGGHLEAILVDLSGDHQSQGLASVTTSASSPSITDRACLPEPPCDWLMVTGCPPLAWNSLAKAGLIS